MTLVLVGVMLALAAVSLGLRFTGVLIPRINPIVRLLAASIIGGASVLFALQICDRYGVHDLGSGLLVSLAPVGIYDLAKWWFRRKT
jgi:hypothetical protein